MFLEARLVQIGSPLDFTVVRAALSILINLERALPTLRHVSSQEGRRVLLELCSLRLDLELVIAVKGCGVLAIDA